MAKLTKCDRCGTIENVEDGQITITRKRCYRSQHDGEFVRNTISHYDVCEKCAREIELLFIGEEEADETIFV